MILSHSHPTAVEKKGWKFLFAPAASVVFCMQRFLPSRVYLDTASGTNTFSFHPKHLCQP